MDEHSVAMKTEHRAGFEAGLAAAADLARLRASQFRSGDRILDPRGAVLHDLAESTAALIHASDTSTDVEILQVARDMVAEEPGSTGTAPCPACGGKLDWISFDDQSRGWCRTEGCLAWLR